MTTPATARDGDMSEPSTVGGSRELTGSKHGRHTIGETFRDRANSLNLLRLVLAFLVVASHTIVLGGYGSEVILGKTTVGIVAVYGFFGISGYLIASSAIRHSLGRYLWQRVLRIFPGFWVCLIVTAFLFGLVAWYHGTPRCGFSCYLHARNGPLAYIARNSWLKLNQHPIAGTPRGVPVPGTWDGSLWSLFYEFLCYLVLAALAVTRLLRRRLLIAALAAGVWIAEVVVTSVPSLNARFNLFTHYDAMLMLQLLPIFLTGSLLYLYRDRIYDNGWLVLGCVVLIVASLGIPLGNGVPGLTLTSTNLVAPFLAYVMIWLGIHLPWHWIGSSNDYSYGVYIYAFPVSQLLAIWGLYRWGYVPFLVATAVGTLPFAAASWWLVERRALRLKRLTLRPMLKESSPTQASRGAVTASATTAVPD